MKAILKGYHQAPRKVGLVAKLIRGKSVPAARVALSYLPKKSAPAMVKLLNSAVANARQEGMKAEDLVVKTITVDKGIVLKRFRPFSRGRAGRIRKMTSIVKIELAPISGTSASVIEKPVAKKEVKAPKKPAAKKAAKKVAKKPKAE